jgi:hypothetical protein
MFLQIKVRLSSLEEQYSYNTKEQNQTLTLQFEMIRITTILYEFTHVFTAAKESLHLGRLFSIQSLTPRMLKDCS